MSDELETAAEISDPDYEGVDPDVFSHLDALQSWAEYEADKR